MWENTLMCLSVEREILNVFQSMCLSQFETLFYLMCIRYDILAILIKKNIFINHVNIYLDISINQNIHALQEFYYYSIQLKKRT